MQPDVVFQTTTSHLHQLPQTHYQVLQNQSLPTYNHTNTFRYTVQGWPTPFKTRSSATAAEPCGHTTVVQILSTAAQLQLTGTDANQLQAANHFPQWSVVTKSLSCTVSKTLPLLQCMWPPVTSFSFVNMFEITSCVHFLIHVLTNTILLKLQELERLQTAKTRPLRNALWFLSK